nr:MAG TPA: hypothetical protein [Caudoviricetes sp.]
MVGGYFFFLVFNQKNDIKCKNNNQCYVFHHTAPFRGTTYHP